MNLNKSIFQHSENLVVKDLGDEKILIPLRSNVADMEQIYTLNETAAFIWEKMDGTHTITDIVNALMDEYEVDEKVASTDVDEFINEMREFLISK